MLTQNEIELVKSSWNTIRKDGKAFGVQLFLNFFTKHPTYQQYFKSFADIPFPELGSSKRLIAHTQNVMYAITALVDNLDDPEVLVEMLHKTGANHLRHKISIDMFDELGPVLVDCLIKALGPQVANEQLLGAWSKTYSIIVEQVKTAYKV